MTQHQPHSHELEDDLAGRRPLASAVPAATVVPQATAVPRATAVAHLSWGWPGANRRTPAGLRGHPASPEAAFNTDYNGAAAARSR
jgi:hypothetical protein